LIRGKNVRKAPPIVSSGETIDRTVEIPAEAKKEILD
jgi:hypothetical protein